MENDQEETHRSNSACRLFMPASVEADLSAYLVAHNPPMWSFDAASFDAYLDTFHPDLERPGERFALDRFLSYLEQARNVDGVAWEYYEISGSRRLWMGGNVTDAEDVFSSGRREVDALLTRIGGEPFFFPSTKSDLQGKFHSNSSSGTSRKFALRRFFSEDDSHPHTDNLDFKENNPGDFTLLFYLDDEGGTYFPDGRQIRNHRSRKVLVDGDINAKAGRNDSKIESTGFTVKSEPGRLVMWANSCSSSKGNVWQRVLIPESKHIARLPPICARKDRLVFSLGWQTRSVQSNSNGPLDAEIQNTKIRWWPEGGHCCFSDPPARRRATAEELKKEREEGDQF